MADMRTELNRVFEGLRDGTIDYRKAVEMNNTAGKIINTFKLTIAYHALRGEKPIMPELAAEVEPGQATLSNASTAAALRS
jgi:hypothetical protein